MVDGDQIFFCELTCFTSSGFGDEEEAGVALPIERDWLAAMSANWFLNREHGPLTALYVAAFQRWAVERRRRIDAESPVSIHPAMAARQPLRKAA